MTKFLVNGNTTISMTNAAAGVRPNIEAFVDAIDGVGKAFDMVETTVLSETAPSFLAGIEAVRTVTYSGPWDDGADADVLLTALLNESPPVAREHKVKPNGIREFKYDCILMRYDIIEGNKEVIRYEAEFQVTGGVVIT